MRTRSELLGALAAPLFAGTLLGCPPTNLYRTAEPTPPGAWQLTGGVGAAQIRDLPQQTKMPTGSVELGVRHGLTDDIDVGGRIFFPGLDVNATLRFFHRGAWSIAVAPQLAFVRTTATGATTNSFTLFPAAIVPVTRRFSRAWAFTFGPSLGSGFYWPETGGHAQGMWLGALLGVEWRVGERVWLVPELTGYRTLAGDVPVDGTFVSFGVGLRIGL